MSNAFLCVKDSFHKDRRTSTRFILAGLFLSAVVVMSAYTGKFTSLLANPQYEYLASNIDEAASRKDVNIMLVKGTPLEDFILVRNSDLPLLSNFSIVFS